MSRNNSKSCARYEALMIMSTKSIPLFQKGQLSSVNMVSCVWKWF